MNAVPSRVVAVAPPLRILSCNAGGLTIRHNGEVDIGRGGSVEEDSGILGNVGRDLGESSLVVHDLNAVGRHAFGNGVFYGRPEAGGTAIADVNGQRGAYAFETETGKGAKAVVGEGIVQ